MGYNDRWDVGDPIGFGNDIGAPEVPYMSYGPKHRESSKETEERQREEEKERKLRELESRSQRMSDEAWELYMEYRSDEALPLIDRALELNETANALNIKAIILEDLKRFPDAISYYDAAMELGSSEVFIHNKAVCLIGYCDYLKNIGLEEEGLSKINTSLEIFREIKDKRFEDEAWNLKGMLLEGSGDIGEAFNCYKRALELAPKDSDVKVTYKKNRDRLLKFIENTDVVCPKCGERLNIADVFCIKCGARIADFIAPVLKDSSSNGMTVEHLDVCDADIIRFDED